MPAALQENRRTSTAATIKRASAAGRRDMNRLDRRTLEQLDRTYRQAAAELETAIRGYAGSDGSLRLEVLQDLLGQVYARLQALSTARDAQLAGGLTAAAQQGIRPFAGVAGDLSRVADEALRFVRTFIAEDGLQLSDRLWRIDRAARERVGEAIQSAVIQGHSASQAASEFLGAGEPVPADIQEKLGLASAESIAAAAGSSLLFADGNARQAAMRLFRTELNRAHGEAYRAAAFETEGVIGTRFLLSPNHPEPDICDMHAAVNRYGLGPGVYPKGKSPWPAHPNTLSYEVVVFEDEVTEEDRSGKEDRIAWLKRQPAIVQQNVLRSRRKRAALLQGILRENEIRTPWHVLEKRYIRRGIDPGTLVVTPPPAAVPATTPQSQRWAAAFDQADPDILDIVNSHPPPRPIAAEPGHGAYHYEGGVMMGSRLRPDTPDGRRTWRHEYGHYIDYRLRGEFETYASNSPSGHRAVREDAALWKSRRMGAYRRMVDYSPALQADFRGRRYSERAYKEARLRVRRERIEQLAVELTPAGGRPPSRDQLHQTISEHFARREDLWGEAWSIASERWRDGNAEGYYVAAQFDDLSFLADNIPDTNESYLNIMDLVGSLTLNKSGSGHTLGYYRRHARRQPAEAFANVFDLLSYGKGGFEETVLEQFAPAFTEFARSTLYD